MTNIDIPKRSRPSGEPTDLAALTRAVAGNFRSACECAKLALVVDCPPLREPLCVDREAWEKIVINLVADAFNATAEGAIEVRLRVHGDYAHLTVRDTPAGVPQSRPESDCPAAARARMDIPARACAGLALVRDLVRLHNGSIDVQSGERGTAYTVRMPLAPYRPAACAGAEGDVASPLASAARQATAFVDGLIGRAETTVAAEVRSTKEAAKPPRGRVVIVDDHADMQAYLIHVLEDAGYEVEVMANGAAALAACLFRPPDAVVSDVVMPGLDGFELIERLRAQERTAMTPVLLLSGHASEESRIAGLTAGADDYLVKPVRRRELVARVEGAIRLARMRAEAARRDRADLEALFSMGPDGVIVIGHDGSVLTANERAQQLFGYSLPELVELRISRLMSKDHGTAPCAQGEQAEWVPATRLVSPIQEFRARRRDGGEFIAEVVLGPLQQFKNEACTIAIVRDITGRKRIERDRAAQERRFRDLSHRLVEVQETERRHLSTELHDRTSPNLAAIRINLKLLHDLMCTRETDDIKALLDDTAALIDETTVSIREISSNLRPTVLDDGGLLPAVAGYAKQFTKRTGIVVDVQASGSADALTPAVRSSVFRIVQEALTNCAKHAMARKVTLVLDAGDRGLSLAIADDGVGFNVQHAPSWGLGLLTMRERAEFAGGRFALESEQGLGTRLKVDFPNG